MGFDATEAAIVARFESQWSALQPEIPFTYDNQGEADFITRGSPWVRVTVLPGTRTQVAMGSVRRWRSLGIVTVQIFTPAGSGTGLATRLADTVRDIFEGSTISGIIFRATSLTRVEVDASWMQHNADTPYQADELR
jgi:hypothetical protein